MTEQVKFKNRELAPIANFLGDIKLAGKASRGRTKLVKLLAEKSEDFQADMDDLKEKYFAKNDDGNYQSQEIDGEEYYVYANPDDKQKHVKEVEEINEDEAVITISEYKDKMKALYDALNNSEVELSNQDALVYDTIMDQLDECFEEKEGNE